MLLIPAIDLKNGSCVRLLQGDADAVTIYSNDPVDMAISFEDAGAKRFAMSGFIMSSQNPEKAIEEILEQLT